MSNTGEAETVVSVTSKGQATIPKRIRERLGVATPGRVKFVEDEETGEVVVRSVQSISKFRGIAEGEKSASELVREAREEERARDRAVLERLGIDPEEES